MSSTDPIAALAAQTQAARATAQNKTRADALGIDDFLTLMTTQLKSQDPLKPLDGTAFVAQLAQFGTVSGVQQMQSSIETLANSLRSTQMLNGATLVDHVVMAPATSFQHAQGVVVGGEVDVPDGASGLQIRITDANGEVVRTMSYAPSSSPFSFQWDGLRNDGTAAPNGAYEIEAIAGVGQDSESIQVLMSGRVSSVSIDANGAGLTLNTTALGPVAMADVRRVL